MAPWRTPEAEGTAHLQSCVKGFEAALALMVKGSPEHGRIQAMLEGAKEATFQAQPPEVQLADTVAGIEALERKAEAAASEVSKLGAKLLAAKEYALVIEDSLVEKRATRLSL